MILKDKRLSIKISQERLAGMLGVSQSAVTRWETGKSIPSIENLKKLSEIFGCTIDELVKGEIKR